MFIHWNLVIVCSWVQIYSWKSLVCHQRQGLRMVITHFLTTSRIPKFIWVCQHTTSCSNTFSMAIFSAIHYDRFTNIIINLPSSKSQLIFLYWSYLNHVKKNYNPYIILSKIIKPIHSLEADVLTYMTI